MGYKFIKEPDKSTWRHDTDLTTVTVEIASTGQSLSDMCEAFTDFLRGVGFSFDGAVEIARDEEEETRDEDTAGDCEGTYTDDISSDESGEESNS